MSIRSKLVGAVSPILLTTGVAGVITPFVPVIAHGLAPKQTTAVIKLVETKLPTNAVTDYVLTSMRIPQNSFEINKKMNQDGTTGILGAFGILGALLTNNLGKLKKVAK